MMASARFCVSTSLVPPRLGPRRPPRSRGRPPRRRRAGGGSCDQERSRAPCRARERLGGTRGLVAESRDLGGFPHAAGSGNRAGDRQRRLYLSGRDLILVSGGLFLLGKSTFEIHENLEGEEGHKSARVRATFGSVLVQIVLLDVVFSLDSVITDVGMVDEISVMIAAVTIAILVMLVSAEDAALPLQAALRRHELFVEERAGARKRARVHSADQGEGGRSSLGHLGGGRRRRRAHPDRGRSARAREDKSLEAGQRLRRRTEVRGGTCLDRPGSRRRLGRCDGSVRWQSAGKVGPRPNVPGYRPSMHPSRSRKTRSLSGMDEALR